MIVMFKAGRHRMASPGYRVLELRLIRSDAQPPGVPPGVFGLVLAGRSGVGGSTENVPPAPMLQTAVFLCRTQPERAPLLSVSIRLARYVSVSQTNTRVLPPDPVFTSS